MAKYRYDQVSYLGSPISKHMQHGYIWLSTEGDSAFAGAGDST
jgi:hypothetical protein